MDYRRVPPEILRDYPPSYQDEKAVDTHISQQLTPFLQPSTNASLRPSSLESNALQHRAWLDKIGHYGILILLLGTLSILLALIFITFLWKGVNATEFWSDNKLSSIWRSVVISGWTTRSITLSSLVVRLAIAAQAGVCTSMFAALALEKVGIPLQIAPEVSVIRNINTGPHHLVSVLIRSSLTRGITCIIIPVVILMVTSVLSQFSSTVLLSDVETGSIIGPTNTTAIPFGYLYDSDFTLQYQGNDYWATKPAFYPTFAEYSEPSSQNAIWYDTGVTKRALLPFNTLATRNALKSYTGMAKILDVRTACIKPSIKASLFGASWAPQLIGHINTSLPSLLRQPTKYYNGIGIVNADFNCTIPMFPRTSKLDWVPNRLGKEWPVSLCRIVGYNDGRTYDGAFLVVNTTAGTWLEVPRRRQIYNQTRMTGAEGPWLNVDFPNTNVSVALSLCFATAFSNSSYVNITSQASHKEPTLRWDVESGDFDTYAIRQQLGVLPGIQGSLQDRGVLELNPEFDLTKDGSNDTVESERAAVDDTFLPNGSAGMCSYCMFKDPSTNNEVRFWTHRDQTVLFQDTLVSTKNPALALQAHYFTLLQMAYYDLLTVSDVTTDAQLVSFQDALIPRSWRGYTIFVSIIFCHLLCILLAVVLYLRLTKLSKLGNSWQSIGQAVTAETETIFENSTTMSDSEVSKRILSDNRFTEEGSATFKIEKTNLVGRIGLARQAGR